MTTNHRLCIRAGILGTMVITAFATSIEACSAGPAADDTSGAPPISRAKDASTSPTSDAGTSLPDSPSGDDDASFPLDDASDGDTTTDGKKNDGGKRDAAADAGDDMGPFAYAISINPNGTWAGIEDPATEMAAIIASGAKYVRFSTPASGTPTVTQTTYLNQLLQAGIHPGAVLITQNGTPASDLIATGKALKQSGFYHWIFVDGALTRTDIQQIIDGLKQVGWDKIMTNDTLFGTPNQVADPPRGVWGHTKLFNGIDPNGPVITPHDDAFIQYIHQHFPESMALLKLEIDSEIEKLKALPTATQIQLLTNWSHAQASHQFTMIYPLFTTTYDSKAIGTYDTQVNLMK